MPLDKNRLIYRAVFEHLTDNGVATLGVMNNGSISILFDDGSVIIILIIGHLLFVDYVRRKASTTENTFQIADPSLLSKVLGVVRESQVEQASPRDVAE